MPNQPKKDLKQVSLEELLRLKRHEKPTPEFWDSFQQELHQKTLGTLVRRESGLAALVKGLALRLAPGLPLAAAALFVMALYLHESVTPASFEQGPSESRGAAEIALHDLLGAPVLEAAPAGAGDFDTSLSTARYVVGAMSARDTSNDRGFTEVPASNHIPAGFNSRVQFVSGGLAASTIGTASTTSIY